MEWADLVDPVQADRRVARAVDKVARVVDKAVQVDPAATPEAQVDRVAEVADPAVDRAVEVVARPVDPAEAARSSAR